MSGVLIGGVGFQLWGSYWCGLMVCFSVEFIAKVESNAIEQAMQHAAMHEISRCV